MPKIIKHWNDIGLEFDAIYSGYMGSAEQIDITCNFMADRKKRGSMTVVDPVLGDVALGTGNLYSDRMKDQLAGMKKLCGVADIITPNVTEASLLIGEEYPTAPLNNAKIKDYLSRLRETGAKDIVITSVMDSENSMCVAVYDSKSDKYYKINCGYINRPFHGTGDVYTSVLTGALLGGENIVEAANIAAGFVYKAIQETIKHPEIKIREGVLFEPVIVKYFSKTEFDKLYIEI